MQEASAADQHWGWTLGDHPVPLLCGLGAAGIIFAMGIAWAMFSQEQARVDAGFQATAQEHGAALENGWVQQVHAIEVLATIFLTSEHVTREEFRRASETILARHESIRALEWVPRVFHAERAEFVNRARESIPGFDFVDYGPDGTLRPIERREVYFPIYYAEPLEANREVLGYDPANNTPRNEALHKAILTGRLTVSTPTTIAQSREPAHALLVFVPVYDHTLPTDSEAARRHALEGLAEGVYMVDSLVKGALRATDSAGLNIGITGLEEGQWTRIASYEGAKDGGATPWYVWGTPQPASWEWSMGSRQFRARFTPQGLPHAYDLRASLALFVLALFLSAAVVGVVALMIQRERRVRTLAELRRNQLHHQATHDLLTGLVSRGAFELSLEAALHNAQHTDATVFSLCYLDLDGFKVVNDIHGHHAGDDVIRQISGRLSARMREEDVFARLGGDEFGVLLENCRAEQAEEIAGNFQQVVSDYRFQYDDQSVAVSVSIGVTEINSETTSVATALGQADAACNIAKEQGRNRIHIFRSGDTVSDQYRNQMLWATELRQALDGGRLELHGQRIAPTNPRGGSDMMEVLVRMRDRDGELVPPGAFIPAAERYSLMGELDRWVVERALALKSRQPHTGSVWCINLSGHSIGEEGLFETISRQLEQHRIPPREICFEITETAVVRSLSRAERFVSQLRRLGCMVALDDFGSGMSSFTYLKHLPVDFLKIDGSFVRNIQDDRMDRAMVHAIQEIANELGIRTIAEYVETATAMEAIRSLGVDYAQGFFVGHPEPIAVSA